MVRSTTSTANYPSASFTGGDVIILTDRDAASAGDVFPWHFLGGNGTSRDLGGSTTMKLFGDIDGRLYGGAGAQYLDVPSNLNPRFKLFGIYQIGYGRAGQ